MGEAPGRVHLPKMEKTARRAPPRTASANSPSAKANTEATATTRISAVITEPAICARPGSSTVRATKVEAMVVLPAASRQGIVSSITVLMAM